jgi:hypothetical protein
MSSPLGRRTVVVGASIGGLSKARVLAGYFAAALALIDAPS